MSGDELRILLRAEPFQPFTLGLMGKTRIRISRPDWAKVSPDGQTLLMYDADRRCQIVSIPHVASITFDPPVQPDFIVGAG
jgi:hypothetical protein